jgi:hypothetical protein
MPLKRPSPSGGWGDTSTHARTSESQEAMRFKYASIPFERRSIEPYIVTLI